MRYSVIARASEAIQTATAKIWIALLALGMTR
jgi:hypothetical protein